MKEAFEHMKEIETSETIEEKRIAEIKWREWKRKHPEIMENIKGYIVNEIYRMARDDSDFRDELLTELLELRKNQSGEYFPNED